MNKLKRVFLWVRRLRRPPWYLARPGEDVVLFSDGEEAREKAWRALTLTGFRWRQARAMVEECDDAHLPGDCYLCGGGG